MNEKILVVDDEVNICELLTLELELEGYICERAYDGKEALEKFETFSPELILLDLMLPEISGIDVCKQITAKNNVPIIMLTAKSEIPDKIVGLNSGADDYITKPFDTGELLARVKALLRRYKNINEPKKAEEYKNGDICVKNESKSVYVCGAEVNLTSTEYAILMLFMKNTMKVFSRESIGREIGYKVYDEDTRAIDMHIQRLRKKIALKTEKKYIETVFRSGYRMRDFNDEV
ncbi:MAG: response regulator transcription factor [Anaerofustis stercorihominis]|nr:response regulator transcription factor [Anaerofustis stercorihominis]